MAIRRTKRNPNKHGGGSKKKGGWFCPVCRKNFGNVYRDWESHLIDYERDGKCEK